MTVKQIHICERLFWLASFFAIGMIIGLGMVFGP